MKYPLIPLGDIAVVRGGSVNPEKFPNETFQLFSIPAYDKNDAEILKGSEIGSSKKSVEPNDVLLSRIVPHIRRCWVVPNKKQFRQIASGEWISFRTDRLNSEFLKHFLVSDPFHSQFMKTVSGVGGSLLRARPAQVYQIKIPLPPLPEQKRIASILDAADALRTKRRQAIAMLDELLQATFLDMFGDPVTNPKGWEVKKLDEVCEKVIDCPHSTPKWSEEGIICLRTSNLGKGFWIWNDTRYVTKEDYQLRTKRSEIETGDIILSREGTVGVLAVVKENMKVCMGQRLVQLRVDGTFLVPNYLLYLLLFDLAPERLSHLLAGSTSKHLNVKDLRKMNVFLPPLTLQTQFANIVEKVEAQKAVQQAHLAELDTLFASLQQRAFAGAL